MMPIEYFLLAASVGLVSFFAAYGSRWIAHKTQAIDQPKGGRKIHTKPIPLLGGLGISVTITLFCILGLVQGWFASIDIQSSQIWGFLISLMILLVVGGLDDRYDLSPKVRFPLYAFAAAIVILSGTGIHQVTHYRGYGAISLDLWSHFFYLGPFSFFLSFPGSFLTFAWLMSVTMATKIMDGLDGLVTGQTMIAAGLIAALTLSAAYFQPPVTVLAFIIFMAFAGFLPSNINPAKQFLGESGSVVAGFSLAFLSVVSGAKMATALMALGLPLVDVGIVAVGRVMRGAAPWEGDKTHLHFRLLEAGLSQRQAVVVLWLIALVFGAAALTLQTRGKVLLLIALVVLTILLSSLSHFIGKKRTHLS